MTHTEAISILRRCQKHNNGIRTLRECAELAGIDYDNAADAREIVNNAANRLDYHPAQRDARKKAKVKRAK